MCQQALIVENCAFAKNSDHSSGIISMHGTAKLTANNCKFSSQKGKGIFLKDNTIAHFNNCDISNNGDDGICAYELAKIKLNNCKINNNVGHGVYLSIDKKSTLEYYNTTFSGNKIKDISYHECATQRYSTIY